MCDARQQERRFLRGLLILAVLVAAWVNPGNLGNVDAARRLRMAHVWWAGGQEVLPSEAGIYGTMGRDGVRRGNFGVGHSLILLPADLLVSPLVARLRLPDSAREAAVAFLSQSIQACLLLAGAYRLLRRLDFDPVSSACGALSLLWLTTALHYIQNAQENLLMAGLAMWGTSLVLQGRDERRAWILAAGGGVFGASLLVRLTTLADAAAAALLLILLDRRRAAKPLLYFGAGYAVMALMERVIQYVRFGNWTRTYYSGIMEATNPASGAPAVFSYPFLNGVYRALLHPGDSVFLYDPLLTWTLILLAVFWRRIPPAIRSYSLGAAASLAVYVLFYATYQSPTGEASWGDRYVTTPVLLLAILAIPLTLKWMGRIPVWGWVVIGGSLAIQLASLTLVVGLEWMQSFHINMPVSIALRFANIYMVWTGEARDSAAFFLMPAEWRTWNFLPFQMMFRYPELGRWALWGWWGLAVACAGQTVAVVRRIGELAALRSRQTVIG